jgi:hypothetical protein
MYGKPAMTCFKYQCSCMVQKPSHFECYTLSGYRASTMSHQTAPTPTKGSPPPYVWQHNFP